MLLDAPTRAALGACIERLAARASGIGWVVPENLHITLKFLGPVDVDRLAAVRSALARAAEGLSPFELAIEGLGAFPNPSRPRVIWAGVGRGRERLAGLAARAEAEVAALGFAPEARSFSGHITLGRLREPRRHPQLESAIAAGGGERFGLILVERVSLMRSDLSPRGARYTEVTSFPIA